MTFDPANLTVGTLVLFGRARGEKTIGKIAKVLPSGKYKVEQMEARGGHPIGTTWTVPASHAFLYEYTGPAPTSTPKSTDAAFAANARVLGLPADCLGKTFMAKGTAYRITGIALNRPKFPVSAERVSDGMQFKFALSGVLRGLGVAPVAPPPVAPTTGTTGRGLIGRRFTYKRSTYEVTDYVPSRPKYPYSVKRVSDGKPMKFTAAGVLSGLLPEVGGASSATPTATYKVGDLVEVSTKGRGSEKRAPIACIVLGETGSTVDVVTVGGGSLNYWPTSCVKPRSGNLTHAEAKATFASIYSQLSPENLTCDGELPLHKINLRRRDLNKALAALKVAFGRELSESEAYAA